MNVPFRSQFAFATAPIVRNTAAEPATAKGFALRAALFGLSILALAVASALVNG